MTDKQKKPVKKWLWLIPVLLLAIVGGVLAVVFGGQSQQGTQTGAAKIYWNVDKALYQDTTTNFSTREAAEDGTYKIRFVLDGQLVELTVLDKRLVNYIDSLDAMDLVFDSEGNVIDAVDASDVAVLKIRKGYVKSVQADKAYTNSSITLNGMEVVIEANEKTHIYDVSSTASELGAEISISQLSFLDELVGYADESGTLTHVFVINHAIASDVYWRIEKLYDSANQSTGRKPDEQGIYSVEMFCNGEMVTLKTKDKELVTEIDYKGDLNPYFCFAFDEEGFITKILESTVSTAGVLSCARLEVYQLDGRTFSAKGMYESDIGTTYSTTLPENCPIYDASEIAIVEGRGGQTVDSLKMGDRVYVWTDVNGTPVFVYISHRYWEGPGYWIYPKRYYDAEKKETKREPNSKGWYEIELVEVGGKGSGVKTYRTQDKALVDYLDGCIYQVCGLQLDGDIIQHVYKSESLYGYAAAYRGTYVQDILGSMVTTASASSKNSWTLILTPDCKVYDVSGYNTMGAETTLQIGDVIEPHRDLSGQIKAIFVTSRLMGEKSLYQNMARKYDSKTGQTTRQPDENGYYVFQMINQGKQVTVKTKKKDLATKIDESGTLSVALEVKKGIVQKVMPASWSTGKHLYSYMNVTKVHSDGTVDLINDAGDNKVSIVIGKNAKIYNTSKLFDKQQGEKVSKVRVGDALSIFTDYTGEVKVVMIRDRKVDNLLWPVNRMYDYGTNESTRVPDAEGWYTVEVLQDGAVKTYKTKDKTLVDQIDAKTAGFALYAKEGVIYAVTDAYHINGISKPGKGGWDVKSISGNKVTVQYNTPGDKDYTGKEDKITLASKAKIYDVSPTAETYGAVTTLRVGDQIRTYLDTNGKDLYVFVVYRANREKGTVGYCEHCGTEVLWNPWTGGSFVPADGHYYLNADCTYSYSQSPIGSSSVDYEIVLDLNGKTFTADGKRAFLVYQGETLTIMDSVGGGKICGTGLDKAVGGLIMVDPNSMLNLLSGTLELLDAENKVRDGGVVAVTGDGATFNIYGGTVTGGRVFNTEEQTSKGGNIYVYKGILNVYGGNITGGSAQGQGGNVYLTADATVNVYGGNITGGSAEQGGNIYVYNNGYATITGGEISGDVRIGKTGNLTLTGAPKIGNLGGGLRLSSGTLVTIGQLTSGAQVHVTADGVFTNAIEQAQAYLEAGYIMGANEQIAVTVKDGAFVAVEVGRAERLNAISAALKENPLDFSASSVHECPVCREVVTWTALSEDITGQTSLNGHYYLTEDRNNTGRYAVNAGASVCIYLNGFNITNSKGNAASNVFEVSGTLNVMGEGTMTGYSTTLLYGAVMALMNGGEVNLCGGTYTSAPGSETAAITVGYNSSSFGTLSIYNGAAVKDSVNSHATRMGGNVSIHYSGSALYMYGGEISGGQAAFGGNIAVDSAKIVSIAGGSILNGTATATYGGSIRSDVTPITITGGVISGGTVLGEKGVGGVIYVYNSTVRVNGGELIGGAAYNGATVYLNCANLYQTAGTITGGTATNGGVVFAGGTSNSVVELSGGTLGGGTANSQGGNIFVKKGILTVKDNAQVTGGISKYQGGSLYASPSCVVNIQGGSVSGGVSTNSYGGNIALEGATLNITGGTVSGGEAARGGNIYAFSNATVTGTGGTITAGVAHGDGGNMNLASGTTVNLSGVTISNGTAGAESDGGGNIYNNCAITLTGCTVTGGSAKYGLSIYAEKDVILDGTTISDVYSSFKGKLTLAGNTNVYGGVMTNTAKLYVMASFSGSVRLDGVAKPASGTVLDNTKYSCEGTFTGLVQLDDFEGRPHVVASGTDLCIADANGDQ